MATSIRHVAIAPADPADPGPCAPAAFWARALDGALGGDDAPGDPEASVTTAAVALLFVEVEDRRTVKNRVHPDLRSQGRSRDEEAERPLALGATPFEGHREPGRTGWATRPEGGEFCVVCGERERARV